MLEGLALPEPIPAAIATVGVLYTPASAAALKTWHLRRMAGDPPHVLRQTLTSLLQGIALESTSKSLLSRRMCPVLTFYADPDRAPIEASLLIDKQSEIVCFEGSGHWLHQERPNEVNSRPRRRPDPGREFERQP